MSMRQYRSLVCSPVISMAYVLPTRDTNVVAGSSAFATVSDRAGSSSGIIAGLSLPVLLRSGARCHAVEHAR
jgi:hypothetical protein